MPISVAMPQITKLVRPQSRSAIASGVPSNADMVILSRIASSSRTASSGASAKPGLSRRNQGCTSSGEVLLCQNIIWRVWNTPASFFGSDMWRMKKMRTPADARELRAPRARARAHPARS